MATVQSRLSFPVKKKTSIVRSKKNESRNDIEILDSDEDIKKPIIITDSTLRKSISPRKNRRGSSELEETPVTPPKQRKSETDEDRENNPLLSPKTPSTLLAKLKINSISCGHGSDKKSRKKLFDNQNDRVMATVQSRLSFPVKKKTSIVRSKKNESRNDIEILDSDEDIKKPIIITDSTLRKSVTPRKNRRGSSELEETPVTPPKQRKSETDEDRENNTLLSPKTPSTLLAKLNINSISCGHGSDKKSRKKLFDNQNDRVMATVQSRLSFPVKKKTSIVRSKKNESRNDIEILDSDEDIKKPIIITDSTLRKKLFDNQNDRYGNARRALHSTVPTHMPARQDELEKLNNFIMNHLENKTSGTMYISGRPGTGKTAALTKTLSEMEGQSKYKGVYINCTSIKSAQAVYSKIAGELGIKSSGRSEKAYLSAIEKYLVTDHKPIILVLDEIDQLDTRKQSVLYTIFEWPAKENSRLILLGIANALDLTDRILPRLQARCELKPQLMHFAPYSKPQIVEIIVDRLNKAGVSEVFNPVAVQMLAGKVASVSGDIRRALDIARRVIELVVQEQRQERVLQPTEINERIENEVFESVGVDKVITVLNNVYGTSQNLQDDVDETVPLQQKLLLCSLILMLKKGKNKDITIGKVYEVYRRVCTKRNLSVIDQSEFVGLCSLLESRGMVKVHGKKEPRLNKISLEWDEDEVCSVLKDKQLMSSVLQDESVLNNK